MREEIVGMMKTGPETVKKILHVCTYITLETFFACVFVFCFVYVVRLSSRALAAYLHDLSYIPSPRKGRWGDICP